MRACSKYHVYFPCKCQLKWKSMACSNSNSPRVNVAAIDSSDYDRANNWILFDHLLCRSRVHFSIYFPAYSYIYVRVLSRIVRMIVHISNRQLYEVCYWIRILCVCHSGHILCGNHKIRTSRINFDLCGFVFIM